MTLPVFPQEDLSEVICAKCTNGTVAIPDHISKGKLKGSLERQISSNLGVFITIM